MYQGEAEHFCVELDAIAASLRAALIADKKPARHALTGVLPRNSRAIENIHSIFAARAQLRPTRS